MFSNPLFEASREEKPQNESFLSYEENFSFKPQEMTGALLEQARTSINNLMQKFEKPKKKDDKSPKEIKEEDDDDFKLLTESFMINLDKLNASNLTIKPMDIEFDDPKTNKYQNTYKKDERVDLASNKNSIIIQKTQISNDNQKNQDFSYNPGVPIDNMQTIQNPNKTNYNSAVGNINANLQTSFIGSNYNKDLNKPLYTKSEPQQNSQSFELKNQTLEFRNQSLEQNLERMQEDHKHFLQEIEGLQFRIAELEKEKASITQKNAEDLENIKSLTQQLRSIQDQTSDSAREFLTKKELLTQQYERQIQEMKETIRLNEDLLRKSITKETMFEAVQLQMEDLQRSNQNLQRELADVLSLLESSKEKFQEKEGSLMAMIEGLSKEVDSFRGRNMALEDEIRRLGDNKEGLIRGSDEKMKGFEEILERKDREIERLREFLNENEKGKEMNDKMLLELQEKVFEEQEELMAEKMRFQSERMNFEAVNKDLKVNIEMQNEMLKGLQRKLEEKDEFLMEKELGFKEKYAKIDELYRNSKEIIENYNIQLEDYKQEKELLIKQLLEEKSRYQQERLSFSDQKRYYEENLKKFEGGIHEKEHKIKGLMSDLLEKESFIRVSIYDKNQEFENIKQEFLKQLTKKDQEMIFFNEKTTEIIKQKEVLEGMVRNYEDRIHDLEGKTRKMSEENEKLHKEIRDIHGKSTSLFENKVNMLLENNERLSRQLIDSEGLMKAKELWEQNARENQTRIREYEIQIKRMTEENERITKEMRDMHNHKSLLLENKVNQLQENNERLSKQVQLEELARKEYEQKLKKNIENEKNKSYVQQEKTKNQNYMQKTPHFNPFTKDINQGYEVKANDFGRESEKYSDTPKKQQYSDIIIKTNEIPDKKYESFEKKYEFIEKKQETIEKKHELIDKKYEIIDKKYEQTVTKRDKQEIFHKKENIREEDIYQEILVLKKEVFDALTSYQNLLAAVQTKKVGTHNLKRYIGDNLQGIFLNYTKILFIYFKPNETFINLLNLNLYIEKPEVIKRKIFSKTQYSSFKDIYLLTGGVKEKEINEMMRNINDFILQFYEFIRRTHSETKTHTDKKFKVNIKENRLSELYCRHCNGIFPIEIYKTHINTCDLYKGGRIYEEDILNRNVSFIGKNQKNSIYKLIDMISLRINQLNDIESKQKVMNLMMSLKNSMHDINKEYFRTDLKNIIRDIDNGRNLSFMFFMNRLLVVLENHEIDVNSYLKSHNHHIDNILSE